MCLFLHSLRILNEYLFGICEIFFKEKQENKINLRENTKKEIKRKGRIHRVSCRFKPDDITLVYLGEFSAKTQGILLTLSSYLDRIGMRKETTSRNCPIKAK